MKSFRNIYEIETIGNNERTEMMFLLENSYTALSRRPAIKENTNMNTQEDSYLMMVPKEMFRTGFKWISNSIKGG